MLNTFIVFCNHHHYVSKTFSSLQTDSLTIKLWLPLFPSPFPEFSVDLLGFLISMKPQNTHTTYLAELNIIDILYHRISSKNVPINPKRYQDKSPKSDLRGISRRKHLGCVMDLRTKELQNKQQIFIGKGFPGAWAVKNPPANAGNAGSVPGRPRSGRWPKSRKSLPHPQNRGVVLPLIGIWNSPAYKNWLCHISQPLDSPSVMAHTLSVECASLCVWINPLLT